MRLEHELSTSDNQGMFVTLTYDNDNVPVCEDGMTLVKNDLQKFFKRLRRHYDKLTELNPRMGRKFRYLAAGEYGDTWGRPHYHCIIIGLDSTEDEDRKAVEDSWRLGKVDIGSVTPQSIGYVTDYLQKKPFLKNQKEKEKYYGKLLPSFQVQSQKIGFKYIQKKKKEMSKFGKVNYHGHFISLPRYYLNKTDVNEGTRKINKAKYYKELCNKYGIDVGYSIFIDDPFGGLQINPKYFKELMQREKNVIAKKTLKKKGKM